MIDLTREQLFAIKIPEKLFTNDPDAAKKEYRKLSMRWHPDRGGEESVFQHIKELYEAAEKKFKDGLWIIPGQIDFQAINGKKFQVNYKKHRTFELGEMYISDTVVVYMINKANKDLIDNSISIFRKFKYANDSMKAEFKRYLPDIRTEIETKDHHVIVYNKTPDLLLLRDVVEHFGELPTEHVAWILSSLYNLVCYFKYCGISHNAISLDTYFISPKHHSGAMLGGWWYSSEYGRPLIALPKKTMDSCSHFIKDKRVKNSQLDLQLVKNVGLDMMNDPAGTKLLLKAKDNPKKYPSPFTTWLRTGPGNDPIQDYRTYKENVLFNSWGPPKFHKLNVSSKDLYDDN